MNNLSQHKTSLNIEGKSKINSKEDSLVRKNSIISDNNNSLFEANKENKNNFSLLSNSNINKTTLTDINKINEYKSKISQLEEQIQKEKNNSRSKNEYGKEISKIQEKILNCQKEIKLYVNKNNRQRQQLQLLSQELDQKIELIDFKDIQKKMKNKCNNTFENKTEKEIADIHIEARQRQLKNIISLIEILENENEKLANKIRNANNTNKYYELLEKQKNQENQINELIKQIKIKKTKLKEHEKCAIAKLELMKKIESIKQEINRNFGKNTEVKKKLNNLENKKKENDKKGNQKPKIILSRNNKSINYRNFSINLQKGLKAENLRNLDVNSIINEKENNQKNNKDKKDEVKDNNFKNNNNNNLSKINEENVRLKKNNKSSSAKKKEEEMIDIPSNISEIFTEKELKAILIGLDRNKIKYKNILKKFHVQNIYVDNLEARHKLELKNKLNEINELDEKIEFLNSKKDEDEADIQLYQNQIYEEKKKKNTINMKFINLNNQVEEKKQIIERKNKEIKILKNQLLKIKKLIKKGDMKYIKDEPEIEVHYLENEDEDKDKDKDKEYKMINNNVENDNNIDRNTKTPKTEGTGYEESQENNFDKIIVKDKNAKLLFPKEEHISGDNSDNSSISL